MSYNSERITVPAGGSVPIRSTGKYFTILNNDQSYNPSVSFGGHGGEYNELPAKVGIPFETQFQGLRIKNEGVSDMEIFYAFSELPLFDNRTLIDGTNPLPVDDATPLNVADNVGSVNSILSVFVNGGAYNTADVGSSRETWIENLGPEMIQVAIGTLQRGININPHEHIKVRLNGVLSFRNYGTETSLVYVIHGS